MCGKKIDYGSPQRLRQKQNFRVGYEPNPRFDSRDDVAQLVSLGGWLRGTEALAALLLQNYPNQKAELLRQPAMLDYFEKRLAGMSANMRTNPIIVRMREGIQKIRLLLLHEDAQISQKTVKEISTVSEKLLKGLRR
jgi:hypothetical protein